MKHIECFTCAYILTISVSNAFSRTAGEQHNKSIPHSTCRIIQYREQALYVPRTPQTHERHCLPPLISFSRLFLWWWPPSQRDRKQLSDRAGGKTESRWTHRRTTHAGEFENHSPVRRVCESRREFRTKKGGDERESTGEFSEGLMIVGFAYEKCLFVSFDIMSN